MKAAHDIIQVTVPMMQQYPIAVGQALSAADMQLGPFKQCVIAEANGEFAKSLRQRFLPRAVLAGPSDSPHLKDLVEGKAMAGEATLFVCEGFACQQPVEASDIARAIEDLA